MGRLELLPESEVLEEGLVVIEDEDFGVELTETLNERNRRGNIGDQQNSTRGAFLFALN